jgi:membrane fusion protein (multidrug efflux system)
MKIFILTVLVMTLVVFSSVNCGPKESAAEDVKKGEGEKKEDEIDIDKLEIPERMKQAIKEGRIPKERIKEFLERRKGTAGAPTVKIERVSRQPIHAYLILNGSVEPERKVEVHSRLSAYVNKIVKEEGSVVKEGDILALLDDTEIRNGYEQARIQLDQARLTRNEEESNFNRSKELKKTDLISEQEFQTAEINFRKARLEYENKLENFKNLELQLSYTKIKSPVEGFVTERLIEVGSRVNPNQQVYTVEDFSPLLVKVYVPTSDIVNLKKGMTAVITTDVLKGMSFEGTIKLINPRIDVQSGTVKVTVEVFDRELKLKPGMFVEVKIMVSDKEDALAIPRKSIQYKDNKPYIFVFREMQVFSREIETGIAEGDNMEVLSGLEEGEAVVTVGVESLKDRMKVRVSQ